MPRAPPGVLGWCLCDESEAYWWQTTGGFVPAGRNYPLILPDRHTAQLHAGHLAKRFNVVAHPVRLALANAH